MRNYIKFISFIFEIIRYTSLNIYKRKEEVLSYILRKGVNLLNAKAGNIRLYDKNKKTLNLIASYGTSKKYREQKQKIKLGEGISGLVFKKNIKIFTLKDIRKSKIYKSPSLAIGKDMVSLICSPLRISNKKIGVWSIYFSSQKKFSKQEKEIFILLSHFISLIISLIEFSHEINKIHLEILQSMINQLEAKDKYLKGHSLKVREYSLKIGKEIGLNKEELEILSDISLLHDIGKILIDSSVLNKASKFNDKEWMEMKKHPIIGAKILYPITKLRNGIDIIKYHHERIDGKGYPNGLKRDNIPYLAKIVCVADAFDAMLSERPYRKALTLKQAKEELIKNAGAQFDSEIVNTLLKLIEKGKIKIKS